MIMMSIVLNHDNDNDDLLPIIHNQDMHDQETHHCNHDHDDHRNHDYIDQLPIIHDGRALQAVGPDKDTGDQGLTSVIMIIMNMKMMIKMMMMMTKMKMMMMMIPA